MKLLIVEDDLEISELLKSYLESEGFSVSVAYNGKTALEIFQKEQFDLLLLDLMIPLINGISVMKQIVKERIEGGANEKAVLRFFTNCPFVCINFDFFWLNKARQLYMDF